MKGEKINESQIYQTLKCWTCTGRPIELPLTKQNMIKYAKYLEKRRETFSESGENTKKILHTR